MGNAVFRHEERTIMKLLKQILKHIPLLASVVAVGLLLRAAGVVYIISTDQDYIFTKEPTYAPVLHGVANALGVGNAGSKKAAARQQDADRNQKKNAKNKRAAKKGYVSSEEEAKLTGKPLKKVIAHRKKVSGGTYIYSKGRFPAKAKKNVLPAVDYNIANQYYLDPPETTYDYINKGIFRQNHDYYAFQSVENDYFRNALFIGDSMSDGLYNYGLIRDYTNFYALESVTVYNVFDVVIPYRTPTEQYDTALGDLLKSQKYRKIYFLLGMNELGEPDTTAFRMQYMKDLKKIRRLQPHAIIYIQGIFHVSGKRSSSDPAFNNRAVVQRNEAISTLANGHDIFYIEPSEAVCDENGDMIAEYTNDGIHLTSEHYPIWRDYLKANAIVRNKKDR